MSQMGWAYGMHGEKNEQRTFVGKPETRRPLETPRIRLEFKFKKGEIFPVHSMKAYKGMEVDIHSFLTSALDGGVWSTSRSGRFTDKKKLTAPAA